MPSDFPQAAADRDQWITARRPPRRTLNSREPSAFLVEDESSADGAVEPVATIFLTNRECPFHCVMCDLWKNTLHEEVPPGAIPAQIKFALDQLPRASSIKLYNSGSFFDPHAIPPQDYAAIADILRPFHRVIVECHPAFLGARCVQFRDLLDGKLEVAIGLETAHPQVLEKLNKRMTLDQFARAADFLLQNQIDLRAFVLVQPPFMQSQESLFWAQRSLEFAFQSGAGAVTLIPTRGGNGAMESLAADREFSPPALATVEDAHDYGLAMQQGRVFVDLWDLKPREQKCCFSARVERLRQMNLHQQALSRVTCQSCGSGS